MEALLCACVLDYWVKMYLTVGLSPKSLKDTDLRHLFPCFVPCVVQLLLLFLLHLSYTCFHTLLFSYVIFLSASTLRLPEVPTIIA